MYKGLIFGLILSVMSGATTAETLPIVGDDDFQPFSFRDSDGQVVGIDIDTMNEVGKRLGVTFEIKLVPWKRVLNMTRKGSVFGGFSLFKTTEREEFSLFTHPVHYSTYRIFSTKNNIMEFNTLSDLFGKKLGIEAGFVISDEFDGAAKRGEIKLVEVYRSSEFLGRMKRGGLDGFVGNDLVIRYKHKSDIDFFGIHALPKPVKASRGAYFVISKAYQINDKRQWQAKITKALQDMEQDGTQDKIISSYFR